MLQISFESDISSIQAEMPLWAQQRIPSITRNALNDIADDAVFAERDKIRGVFDRPTPFTERAVVFPSHLRATKERLEAVVMLRDEAPGGVPPAKYLAPEVQGGRRGDKSHERALKRAGIMRPDEYTIPAIGYRRDRYGNVPGPTITAIMSQLKVFSEVGFKMNETQQSRRRKRIAVGAGRKARYFVPKEGSGLRRGVYERVGNKVRAVLIFVRQPTYRRRFDFGQATVAKAERVFEGYFNRYFYAELAKATGQGRGSF